MSHNYNPHGYPRGKMKTLYGLYKICGKELFLELAGHYSPCVYPTVEATLSYMESLWFDETANLTLADKMVRDYNEHEGIFTPPKHICRAQVPAPKEVTLFI